MSVTAIMSIAAVVPVAAVLNYRNFAAFVLRKEGEKTSENFIGWTVPIRINDAWLIIILAKWVWHSSPNPQGKKQDNNDNYIISPHRLDQGLEICSVHTPLLYLQVYSCRCLPI
jgi:hypothetical protein